MLNKKLKWSLQLLIIQSRVNNIDKFESIETLKFYVSYFFISAISMGMPFHFITLPYL